MLILWIAAGWFARLYYDRWQRTGTFRNIGA